MFKVGITLTKWNAKGVKRQADAVAKRRVLKAANFLQQRIRRNISKSTRNLGPSKPGEYPHRKTGHLHKTIFRRPVSSLAGPAQDVGTKVGYGVTHELGERPFITRTYYEQAAVIKSILMGGAVPKA